jgi:6-phosphofructokinase 2
MIATLTLNPTVDESASVDRVVAERKLRLTEPAREPGGGGLNVARAARELGEEVLAVWTRGGHTGGMLEDLLEAEELPSLAVPIAGMTRTSLVVHETSSNLQYRFGTPGPRVSEAELDAVLEALRTIDPPPRFLVASGSLPPGVDRAFYARLAAAVDPGRTRLVLDTSGEPLRRAIAGRVFLVKPNLRELATLAGRELESDADIQEAACGLVAASGVEVVLASLGAGGAVLAWSGGCERIHAPTVPIRSKVGAGDSTVAGVVVGLSRGLSVPEAARFGVAAGSAAVMTPGTELCRRADVERLYAELHLAVERPASD